MGNSRKIKCPKCGLEVENGWNYAGFMQTLAQNPVLTLKELGMAVCDSFLEDCERKHTADTATLSLLDLIEKMTRKHS